MVLISEDFPEPMVPKNSDIAIGSSPARHPQLHLLPHAGDAGPGTNGRYFTREVNTPQAGYAPSRLSSR